MKKNSKYIKDYLSKDEQNYLWVEIRRSVAHAYDGLFVYCDNEQDRRMYEKWCRIQGFQFNISIYYNYIGILWGEGKNVRLVMGKEKPMFKEEVKQCI